MSSSRRGTATPQLSRARAGSGTSSTEALKTLEKMAAIGASTAEVQPTPSSLAPKVCLFVVGGQTVFGLTILFCANKSVLRLKKSLLLPSCCGTTQRTICL
jgi:hypothetical protein